jgi:hypothetical protein
MTYNIWGIRDTEISNVFAAGGFGEVRHYNGMNWRSYFAGTALADRNYYVKEV